MLSFLCNKELENVRNITWVIQNNCAHILSTQELKRLQKVGLVDIIAQQLIKGVGHNIHQNSNLHLKEHTMVRLTELFPGEQHL